MRDPDKLDDVEYEEYLPEEDEPEEPHRRSAANRGGHGIELELDELGQPLVRRRQFGTLQSSRGWGNY